MYKNKDIFYDIYIYMKTDRFTFQEVSLVNNVFIPQWTFFLNRESNLQMTSENRYTWDLRLAHVLSSSLCLLVVRVLSPLLPDLFVASAPCSSSLQIWEFSSILPVSLRNDWDNKTSFFQLWRDCTCILKNNHENNYRAFNRS